jgi:NAD(P)-dependent dehydrogenase (short-subunit alcohol dehydrogenase family)
MTLQNKKIVVAGGSSGIGLSTARRLKDAGAVVTVTGRNAEKLNKANTLGLSTAQLDSSKPAALETFFTSHGNIDHLVITVGGSKGMGNFQELSMEDLQGGFEEKFWPQLYTLKAALPYLQRNGSATLITAISSTAKLPGTSGLAAINAALESMIPILSKELRPLRVNAVSPGVIDTEWWNFAPEKTKNDAFEKYASQTDVGRIGRPDDIAHAIHFLIENEYMTGEVIVCDGGLV